MGPKPQSQSSTTSSVSVEDLVKDWDERFKEQASRTDTLQEQIQVMMELLKTVLDNEEKIKEIYLQRQAKESRKASEVHEVNQPFQEKIQEFIVVQEAPIIQENNGSSLPWTLEVQEESFLFQESGGVGLTNTQERSGFLEDIAGEVTKVLEPKVLGLGLTWLDKRQSKAQLAATKKYNGVMCSGNTELLFQENAPTRCLTHIWFKGNLMKMLVGSSLLQWVMYLIEEYP